ncbi:MAG: IS4 family transposase [Betaproteobacteria bacterium]
MEFRLRVQWHYLKVKPLGGRERAESRHGYHGGIESQEQPWRISPYGDYQKKSLRDEIRRFRQQFAQGGDKGLSNVLAAGEVEQLVRHHGGGHRDRIYPPLKTLELFIGQALDGDDACQDAVARNLSERTARGAPECSLNTGPYCKARQRLPLELIVEMQHALGRRMESAQPEGWRWLGHPVKLLDGTTVSMPDTEENQEAFPQSRTQRPGLGFPLARVVAIMSLGTGAVLDWAIGACQGKGTGEQALFRQLLGALAPGDIVLADELYCSYWILATLQARGVDVLMHQSVHRTCDFRCGKHLGRGDHIVQWKRPAQPAWMDEQTYAVMPETIQVREVKVNGRVLVTTLYDTSAAPTSELDRLYGSRWNIELDLRSIKTEMGMDILRCKTPEMIRKEVAVHLLAYTLVRAVMAQAASLGHVLARALRFKAAAQVLNAYQQQLRHSAGERSSVMIAHVLGAISMLLLPHRPNRVEPRAIKRRPKPNRLLLIPRALARRQILAHRGA